MRNTTTDDVRWAVVGAIIYVLTTLMFVGDHL